MFEKKPMVLKALSDEATNEEIQREIGRQFLSDISEFLYHHTYQVIVDHSDSLTSKEQNRLFMLLQDFNDEFNNILPFCDYREDITNYA